VVTTDIGLKSTQPIAALLSRLWHHISRRRRKQFLLLLVLMILASFAEVLSIGALLPFLAVLTTPARVFEHPMAQPWIHSMGLETPQQLLLPLTVLFCFSALLAGAMRLLLLWSSMRLSYATGADISNDIYRNTLYQPYAVHVARNSSEVMTGILIKANGVISCVITPLLTLISVGVMLTAILIALLSIEPMIALLSFGGFSVIYVSISRISHGRILRNSQRVAHESNQIAKNLQEGLGAIRDVLIGGSQNTYCQQYSSADLRLRRAQSDNAFIIGSPRYVMEALGMLLIALLAYLLTQQMEGVGRAIPVLGALALGAQRMLPALQQAYAAWSSIKGEQASLQDTLDLLDQPLPDYANHPEATPMPFRHHIELDRVSLRYSNQGDWILKDLSLTIAKGSRVGFIGTTGSGKSTLLDIVMGLLPTTAGTLKIDGQLITPSNHRSWQVHMASVSQAIFLTDNSIEENIAFGVPPAQIDHARVELAARQAHIADVIDTLPQQYKTLVGERGVRLSGGQRQRIGIARALYRRANVIIFDEATSALDNETEEAVMQAIAELSEDLTVLIIAHRLTTLKNCTQIVELGNCGIKRIGTYGDIIGLQA
jgi:ABC-type multidrug transport system fused ATPase/permease subunit